MNPKILAAVLHRANACPPANNADVFYEIKQLILETWGTRIGTVVQRIQDPCWGPYGRECGDECYKCGGTGIFSTRYFLLEEWEFEGRIFHRPIGKLERYEGPIGFEGRKKSTRTKGALLCFYALKLLFRGDCLLNNEGYKSCEALRRCMRVANAIGPIPKAVAMQLWTLKPEQEIPF